MHFFFSGGLQWARVESSPFKEKLEIISHYESLVASGMKISKKALTEWAPSESQVYATLSFL